MSSKILSRSYLRVCIPFYFWTDDLKNNSALFMSTISIEYLVLRKSELNWCI